MIEEDFCSDFLSLFFFTQLSQDLRIKVTLFSNRPPSLFYVCMSTLYSLLISELCSTEKISSLKHQLQSILKDKFLLIRQDLEETMGKKRKLRDTYTELCIIEGTTGVNNVHEVAAMQLRQTETRTCSGNSVELSDIFSNHYHTGIPAKRVLTLGIAGVGKTVAVQKFVLDWAENQVRGMG